MANGNGKDRQMHSVLALADREYGVGGGGRGSQRQRQREKEINWRFLAADGKILCNRMFAFDYVHRTHAVHIHGACIDIHIHLGNLYQAAHSCESRNANYKWVRGVFTVCDTLQHTHTQQTNARTHSAIADRTPDIPYRTYYKYAFRPTHKRYNSMECAFTRKRNFQNNI